MTDSAVPAEVRHEWVSWGGDDPEPSGVSVVRDGSGIVSYDDSPEWQRLFGGEWVGFKGGLRVTLSWAGLLATWGPVTGRLTVKVAA